MWDLFETVRRRRSIRNFSAQLPVEPEKLHAILETACAAPSAGDLQSYRIVAVTGAADRKALKAAAFEQAFVGDAPVSLVFCADRERARKQFGERGRDLFATQDATIAASYAQLAVAAAGLGSTWVGEFDTTALRSALSLEPQFEPVAVLCIGYPSEPSDPTPRRPLDELVQYR